MPVSFSVAALDAALAGISDLVLISSSSMEDRAGQHTAGNARFSATSRADFAQAIAVAAADPAHGGKIQELAGDRAFTMAEMAAEVSGVTGKTIPCNSLPADIRAGILQGFGLSQAFAGFLADADVKAQEWALFDDSGTLSKLIGHPKQTMWAAVVTALA